MFANPMPIARNDTSKYKQHPGDARRDEDHSEKSSKAFVSSTYGEKIVRKNRSAFFPRSRMAVAYLRRGLASLSEKK